jgi:Uma2 family endonuclease
MGDAVPRRLTADEYIALDRAAQTKSEFFDGVMYAMSGGSPRHNLVATNLARAIGVRLRGKPCIVVNSDQRVLVSETGLYTYPDVTIVCGGMKVHERFSDTMTNPTIVFEVLSPTTEAYDRGEKFAQYRARESLREYVLVNPYEPFVEHYARAAHGEWVLRTVEGGDAAVSLAAAGIAIPLAELHEGADQLPPDPDAPRPRNAPGTRTPRAPSRDRSLPGALRAPAPPRRDRRSRAPTAPGGRPAPRAPPAPAP